MKDIQDKIIYIGKAKNLKRRVQSYFQKSKAHPQKIKKMISNIHDFDCILTDTEFEAFMLECRLIKEMKPVFNKKMKSSGSYVYLVIHTDEETHRIEVTNRMDQTHRKVYFGPFISRHTVEKALLAIKESFHILCSSPSQKNSPCFNYSLGLCIGTCLGGTAIEQHNLIIQQVIRLLEGKDLSVIDELEQKMQKAALNLDFKGAAKLRDQLILIKHIVYKAKVIEFIEENKNIVVIEFIDNQTFKLFLIKRNTILFKEKYHLDEKTSFMQLSLLIKEYLNNTSLLHTNEVSKEEMDESQIIYRYLESSSCQYIEIPAIWLKPSNFSKLEDALYHLLKRPDKSPQVSP